MKNLRLRPLCAAVWVLCAISPAFASDSFTVVVSGLQHPRGLSFGREGRLYVAQAGTGGGTETGKITEIRYPWREDPVVHDVVTGLISDGPEATAVGVAGLSAVGNRIIYAIMDESDAATRAFRPSLVTYSR